MKTVGSYFAHLSTVFDYVRHAMPFGDAQSLTNDELYAVVAYMLFLNDIVDEKFVLSRETFGSVKMPNAGGFYDDDRETTEKAFWNRALHDELQGRGEGHRPRARDRRHAGRQAPAARTEHAQRTSASFSAPRRAVGKMLADMLGEQLGELLRVARQNALPVPQHGELEQQRIAPIGHAADAELAEIALQDRREDRDPVPGLGELQQHARRGAFGEDVRPDAGDLAGGVEHGARRVAAVQQQQRQLAELADIDRFASRRSSAIAAHAATIWNGGSA